MPTDSFRKYMSPDFQAQAAPQLEWMPWQQDTMQQDVGNISNTIGQLKPKASPMTKGGAMAGGEGKASMLGGAGKAAGGAGSL